MLTVGLELLLGLGIALLLQKPTRFNNSLSILLLLPLMTAPALAALMWKLMTNPNFGILSYLRQPARLHRFPMGLRPVDGAVHGRAGRHLGLHAVHHDPAAGRPALAAARSRSRRRRSTACRASFVFFRITLPMLMPYIITATLFRLLDSIQQFDIIYAMTQGGPGDTLLVFQVQAYLEFFQYTNVGRSAALLIILWAITYFLSNIFIKHWLRLRERARGASLRMAWITPRPSRRIVRGVLLALVVLFFLFPIFWIFLMSFQTNETILRIPPRSFFEPTLRNYAALITGKLQTAAGTLDIAFMQQSRGTACSCRPCSVLLALLLGVPAAYAFARFKFRLGENIAFTLLSFRFAPPLLVLLPLSLYFQQLGLDRHLYRPDLGLSADLPAADPVDRARLFRGHQPRHRACLSHRRPFLVADLHARSPCRWRGPASPRPACSPSSSPGTISSSR